MTARKPLVLNQGSTPITEQLQAGDVLAASSVVSTDATNLLGVGSDGGTTYQGQIPQAAIVLGATTPVPPGGVGAEYWSTTLDEIVRWNGTSWAQIVTITTGSGGVLPAVTSANNSDTLQVVAGNWSVVSNPYSPLTFGSASVTFAST